MPSSLLPQRTLNLGILELGSPVPIWCLRKEPWSRTKDGGILTEAIIPPGSYRVKYYHPRMQHANHVSVEMCSPHGQTCFLGEKVLSACSDPCTIRRCFLPQQGPQTKTWDLGDSRDPALLKKEFECAAKAFTPMGANWPYGTLNLLTWMGPEETT